MRSRNWARCVVNPNAKIALLSLVAAGTAFGAWRAFVSHSDVDKGILILGDAYRYGRPLESRVTGMGYAPMTMTRGSQARDNVDGLERDRAATILLGAAVDHPGSASKHGVGEYYLTQAQFDKAVHYLRDAVASDANNARYCNDLGAALLEKGRSEREAAEPDTTSQDPGSSVYNSASSIEDFAEALEWTDRALELDPSLPDALFNRALCCQHLALWQRANYSWAAYLEKDSNSGWAQEAHENLKSLESRNGSAESHEDLSRDFGQACRTGNVEAAWRALSKGRDLNGYFISDELVDSYVAQSTGQKQERANAAQELMYAARLYSERSHDSYPFDLGRLYTSAASDRLARLAEARGLLRKAKELSRQSRFSDAIETFTEAEKAFERQDDPNEALLAELCISRCHLFEPRPEIAVPILKRLLQISTSKGYMWLRLQCLNELANAEISFTEYSDAVDDSLKAKEVSIQILDEIALMHQLVQLGEEEGLLHDYRASLGFLLEGLSLGGDGPGGNNIAWGTYVLIAFDLDAAGFTRAALDCQTEALPFALKTSITLIESRAYEYVGVAYARTRRLTEAMDYLNRAFEQGRSLADERGGSEIMANASLQMGNAYREAGMLQKAIDSFTTSLDIYDKAGFPYYNFPAHKGKLLTYIAMGEKELAESELKAALKPYEEGRARIREESKRDLFFDAEQDIYEVAIDFEYSQMNNSGQALAYSEAARARSFLDLIEAGPKLRGGTDNLDISSTTTASSPTEIQEAMPDNVQIIEYSVLPRMILIWVIQKDRIETAKVDIQESDIEHSVSEYLTAVTIPGDDAAHLSQQLYGRLIGPIEHCLDPRKEICIVPDKILWYLPFAALNTASKEPLIQNYVLLLSPSATAFNLCTDLARAKSEARTERLLSVGNPHFDHKDFNLEYLRDAQSEAQSVAGFYRSTSVLVWNDATPGRVLSELPKADVAHFAVHSLINAASPLRSALLLAKPAILMDSSAEASTLKAKDVYRLKLPRTRLIVLSTCESSVERVYRGEGAINLARPFMVAGVPVVIGSLWKVDSTATADLMLAFHKYRTDEGMSSAQALRQAQLDMLQQGDARYRAPYYWASFVYFGGFAKF